MVDVPDQSYELYPSDIMLGTDVNFFNTFMRGTTSRGTWPNSDSPGAIFNLYKCIKNQDKLMNDFLGNDRNLFDESRDNAAVNCQCSIPKVIPDKVRNEWLYQICSRSKKTYTKRSRHRKAWMTDQIDKTVLMFHRHATTHLLTRANIKLQRK